MLLLLGLTVLRLGLQENLVVHTTLDNQQAGCDERFFEKLRLKHLHKMLNPELLGLLSAHSLHVLIYLSLIGGDQVAIFAR